MPRCIFYGLVVFTDSVHQVHLEHRVGISKAVLFHLYPSLLIITVDRTQPKTIAGKSYQSR